MPTIRKHLDSDALNSYLGDLSGVALLSREEEVAVAREIEAADSDTAEALFAHPLGADLVHGLLSKLAAGALEPDDLTSAGEPEEADPDERVERERARLLTLADRLSAAAAAGDRELCIALLRELRLERWVVVRLAGELSRSNAVDGPQAGEVVGLRARFLTNQERAERARTRLVQANLRLVVAIAKRYVGRGLMLLDLIQEGNLGLMRAIESFEWQRGYRLATYASWWIRQSIQHAISEQSRTIRVPRHMVEAAMAVERTTRSFHERLGREPTCEEIANELHLPVARVTAALELVRDALSLETPFGHDDSLALGELIADTSELNPADRLLAKDFSRQAEYALESLTERERDVVRLRFGLGREASSSLEEIASQLGTTREQVRQVEARALRKLQHAHRTRHLRAYARD